VWELVTVLADTDVSEKYSSYYTVTLETVYSSESFVSVCYPT